MRHYTAECVLPVNLFNDKIFLMYWWWFLILACLSFLGELLKKFLCFFPKKSSAFFEATLLPLVGFHVDLDGIGRASLSVQTPNC